MELGPGVWSLTLPNPGGAQSTVNAYLLRDRRGYALLDCGQGGSECWNVLLEKLAELGVPAEAIHTVILTHGHPDHAGAAVRLQEHVGAKILLHERELEFMRTRAANSEPYRGVMIEWLERYGFPEDEAVAVIESVTARFREAPVLEPDRLLASDEELEFDPLRVRVIRTPGHTPGHVCLYEPRRRWLFCGDHALPDLAPNVSLQPLSTADPLESYLRSLEQIARQEVDLTLPGHGQPMTNLAARIEQLVQHQSRRQDQLLEILTPRPQSAYELGSQVWREGRRRNWATFDGRLRRNAVGTLAAHLEHLAARGLVARHEDGVVRFSRPG